MFKPGDQAIVTNTIDDAKALVGTMINVTSYPWEEFGETWVRVDSAAVRAWVASNSLNAPDCMTKCLLKLDGDFNLAQDARDKKVGIPLTT